MNKQELIEELARHASCLEDFRGITGHCDGKYEAYEIAIELAKQLDEPQKPVVAEFVAEWFEDAKDNLEIPIFYECVRAMEISKEYRNEFHQWFANSKNNPIETLIRMKDGYEVEKEPMYYIKLPGGKNYDMFVDGRDGNLKVFLNGTPGTQYTEQQIKAIDERYWPFAVPVKEVEG